MTLRLNASAADFETAFRTLLAMKREVSEDVDRAAKDIIDAVIARVAEKYAAYPQDRLDGLTIDCGDWWFNVRASNTEPLLRLNLEAATRDECDTQVAALLALITA